MSRMATQSRMLTVSLRDAAGRQLESVVDVSGVLDAVQPELQETHYQCLRFVDRHGSTVFNWLQAHVVLEELKRIASRATTAEERRLLAAVSHLAEECQQSPDGSSGLFLSFTNR